MSGERAGVCVFCVCFVCVFCVCVLCVCVYSYIFAFMREILCQSRHAFTDGSNQNKLRYMYKVSLHAQSFPTCPKFPYMHKVSLHAQSFPTCTKFPYMHKVPLHAQSFPTCTSLPTCKVSLHAQIFPTCTGSARFHLYACLTNLMRYSGYTCGSWYVTNILGLFWGPAHCRRWSRILIEGGLYSETAMREAKSKNTVRSTADPGRVLMIVMVMMI